MRGISVKRLACGRAHKSIILFLYYYINNDASDNNSMGFIVDSESMR